MNTFSVPQSLHDVLGEKQSPVHLLMIFGFASVTTYLMYSHYAADFQQQSLWRSIAAIILFADIAAGALANYSKGTSAYYAQRPKNRKIFIAIHVHLLALSWLLYDQIDLSTWILWGYTILAASLVNLFFNQSIHRFISGAGLCIGLFLLGSVSWESSFLQISAALFLLKVVHSFAVDHYGDNPSKEKGSSI